MEDKYYIPTIEEFHVGFEYESKENFMDGTVKSQEQFNSAKWIKETVSIGDIPYINRALNGRNADSGIAGIRVKKLDKEDIVSLGFIALEKKPYADFVFKIQGRDLELDLHIADMGVCIGNNGTYEDYICLFNGKIKNISELKQVLKFLEIL